MSLIFNIAALHLVVQINTYLYIEVLSESIRFPNNSFSHLVFSMQGLKEGGPPTSLFQRVVSVAY